jgi:hypothetical protein
MENEWKCEYCKEMKIYSELCENLFINTSGKNISCQNCMDKKMAEFEIWKQTNGTT